MGDIVKLNPRQPLPPAQPTCVVQIFGSLVLGHFYLVVIDPEFGTSELGDYPKEKLEREIVALKADADSRDVDFEVHDLSEQIVGFPSNDNSHAPQ